MKIDDLVAVSGLSGLYKVVATRNNGMIIEDIDTHKSQFASVRKHQFTPLATIAIYTDMDAMEISEVFDTMMKMESELPVPDVKSKSNLLFEYFAKVLPDYDRDRVLVSDVKKVIKWYKFLRQRDLFPFETDKDETVSGEEE